MIQITLLSPNRRAGRTMLTLALAHLLAQEGTVVLVDGNLHVPELPLWLDASDPEAIPLAEDRTAVIDPQACTACDRCRPVCRWGAIAAAEPAYVVESAACSGCLACLQVCPAEAIAMQEGVTGHLLQGEGRLGTVFHALLAPGREGLRLAVELKQQASHWAVAQGASYLLVDGPAGEPDLLQTVGTGADLALVLLDAPGTEPERLPETMATARTLGRQVAAVLNRHDLAPLRANALAAACVAEKVPVVGHLPFTPGLAAAADPARPLAPFCEGATGQELRRLWRMVRLLLG